MLVYGARSHRRIYRPAHSRKEVVHRMNMTQPSNVRGSLQPPRVGS